MTYSHLQTNFLLNHKILFLFTNTISFHMNFRRNTKRKNSHKEQDSDQQFQHSYDPSAESNVMQETRTRPSRKCKINYADLQEKALNQVEPEQLETVYETTDYYQFLTPQVECLLWKQEHEQPNKQRYLVKYIQKSYLQTQWLTKAQLSAIKYQLNSSILKSLKVRMRKTMDLKLKQGLFFNPNYLIPDRILISTEIFTAIHHKRANDIKGKWDESIMLVCQKLLNFVKDSYPYGVLLHEPYNEQLQKAQGITARINIGQILNKIYLVYYKNQWDFWMQLGMAIRNYLKIYKPEHGDYHKVGLVMKECAVFLYEQWHRLCTQRYHTLKKQLASKQGNPLQLNLYSILFQQNIATKYIKEQTILIDQLCKSNIFLTDKVVDCPRSQIELQLLNPSKFSYDWLNDTQSKVPQQTQSSYRYLTQNDLRNLDLNVEVDKLYYIKWKDLSYAQASWQSEKRINCPQKIQQFRLCNKIPVREIRQKIQLHNKIHRFLMDYYELMTEKKDNRPSENITRMQATLYRLDAGLLGKPKQYKPEDNLVYKNYRKLKDFQIESLNWLLSSWYENRNTILADEMGLGKTIQTIAFLYHLYTHQNLIGPFLVLAPLTTLHQWRRQIEEWTNFNCLLYYDEGRPQIREMIRQYEFYHLHTTKTGDIIPSKIPKFQVLLTNYELFLSDFQQLKRIPFQHLVLDQAHRLKNKTTKTTRTLSLLPCRRKTLLTGTPIQNNTRQLWTLLNFIQPKDFASEQEFMAKYGNLSTQQQVKDFKKMLKPYLLRRVKEDVQSTIPKLSETIIDVQMTSLQKRYYRGIIQKNKTSMIKSLTAANFNSVATQLRKCCNHPYLISPETQTEIKSQSQATELELFIKSSGKTLLLMKLLEKFKRQGKKVLLFSQFVIMLDLLKPFLEMDGYNCEILKGSQSSTTRHQAITRFNHQKTDIFLISTKAGGVGINLVAATEIIIFDSDWNPQNDIQATARAHRIGQKKQVTVYRLITANSYESAMFQASSKKLGLDKAVFSGDTFKSMGQFDETQKQLSKADIEMLLKRGIVGFLDSKIDEQQFFNQTIEDILQKNARKVQYSLTQNSCTFSKTKFKSEEQNDIQIDAKDFWEQALKNVETPLDKLVNKRTELKQYLTLESQQNLLLEAYKIVFQFVKQKSGGTNFNAEDERNLLRFLQAINSDRHFDRHLREIADQLLVEIIKPSRRFKVKEEEIRQINTQHQIRKDEEANGERKSNRIKQQKKGKTQNYGFTDEGEADQISDIQQEKEDTPEEELQKNQDQKFDEDYQTLCFVCERPKCTISCQGICGRSFHRKCFSLCDQEHYEKPQPNQLEEISLDLQKWRQARQLEKTCANCSEKNYNFKCSICLKAGTYQPEDSVNHKKKKIAKIKKEESKGDENALYRCSVAGKCNKFFHLACLFSAQFEGKFSDHTGKTVKDVSNVSKLFRCPAHYCNLCYGIDPKSTKLRSFSCIRCCLSYHDKCLDKQKFRRLGHQHYYICAEHMQTPESIQKMTQQIRLFRPNKRDRLLIKKKSKETKALKKTKKQREVEDRQDEHEDNKNNSQSTHELRRRDKKRHKQANINVPKTIEQQEDKQSKQTLKSKSKGDKQSKIKKQLQTEVKKQKSRDVLRKDYLKYNLTPISEFEYEQYSYNWCRYCGSRYAASFELSPWGNNKLCSHHHHKWKEGALRLDKYKNEPKHPIKKDKDNEIRYLNEYIKMHKVLPEEAISQLNDKKYNDQTQKQ